MKQVLKILLLSIFFLLIYLYLFNSGLIKYLVLGSSSYFGDYQLFKNALNCMNKGLSPYIGPTELNCVGFNYGHAILFFTPFKNLLINADQYIVPSFLMILFVVSTIKILNPKNYLQLSLTALALLNPSTLLLIERMNLDILLYLIIIVLAFNRIYFLNWLLVVYCFLFKFHPFIYGIIIFVEKKKRKLLNLFIIFILIFILSLIFIFIFNDEYILMFENSGAWKMGLHYLFSIKTIPKILKEAFNIHYGLILLITYIMFTIQSYKGSAKLDGALKDSYTFNKKLFLLSANSLVFCFLTFSNAFYREVFLILTIPYLLINMNIKYFRTLFFLFFLKFLFNFIYILDLNYETFYYAESIRIYNNHFLIIVFFKGVIDYVLMLLISSIALRMNLDLLNSYKINKIRTY